ncbi:calcium/sodium antiporter [Bovifimicola ammoniilytica]|jgi:cation:H+ antiporter|uniref:calcium/sodium antiporter n=1 Tax=Bovifimicola ammoniilytica TaxID=2981720 RepID=UPI000340CE58|nr:calcium/sodium antiporter [Bovifimicola ammoniilytica]MCI5603197.1 calcium/sodium antiporter [Clostridiales bacterium]MDY6328669.1 calcium/sodium antiporter [Lachnospiraceae bacterium]CCZ02932.1 k+-dependent Na+/Ca+ exchanger family protein [Eubacterium sp. CAG:603]SCJ85903.1 Inner membrane protein yrbG [uncultured Eubacterium sp.]MCU6754488.1 calcium/sodium antiporter [Bovifimicola ammoniilytica]
MNFLINLVLLVVGFVLLIKGADYFVEGASKIADKLGIPQLVIGLTIVAFGTSAPEAAISISSAIKGNTGIAIGNIIGSNIMNILLILGITSCITVLKVAKSTVYYEIPFVIFITTVLVVIGGTQGKLGFISGIILWALFILFFVYLIKMAKSGKSDGIVEEGEAYDGKKDSMIKLIFITLAGMAAIVIGSDLTVDGATEIAKILGISDRIIGLTIVAFGTSLPELITSVTAGIKGKADIAIGNIVGSNIFNILFVLGTTSLIKSVPYSTNFVIDGIVAIAAAVLLFLGVVRKKQLGRMAGIIMLIAYAGYFAYLIVG